MMLQLTALRTFAVGLIIAGSLALAYGGFTYTKDTDRVDLGPVELSVKDKETVNIPVWLGVGSLAAGVVLLFMRK